MTFPPPSGPRRGSRVLFVRISHSEYDQLRARAQAEQDTVSGVVRDILADAGIDAFAVCSVSVARSLCQTPP